MAISVDWPSGVITINQTDSELTLISGTSYAVASNEVWQALKALEDDEAGIVWPRITKRNAPVSIDGVNYVPAWQIINGYTIQFLPDTSWRARMDGATNNNLHSEGILIENQVQVIPSNSAGNTTTETGVSGLTGSESAALLNIETDVGLVQTDVGLVQTDVETLNVYARAKKVTSQTQSKLLLVDSVTGRTFEAALFEDEAETLVYDGEGIEVQDQIVETTT